MLSTIIDGAVANNANAGGVCNESSGTIHKLIITQPHRQTYHFNKALLCLFETTVLTQFFLLPAAIHW